MTSWNAAELKKQEFAQVTERRRYGVHMLIVVALVLFVTVSAIASKSHSTIDLDMALAIFTVAILAAIYFRSRIVLLGPAVYITGLALLFAAAILFGI
jgi:hypothetical protein